MSNKYNDRMKAVIKARTEAKRLAEANFEEDKNRNIKEQCPTQEMAQGRR